MRVLLLVSDSRPAGKSGGRAHFSPGFVDVDGELADSWLVAGLALNIIDGAVVAPASIGTLCAEHASDGRSCQLPIAHKGGRHFDVARTGTGSDLGANVAAGWWPHDVAIGAAVLPSPAVSMRPCPTIGCDAGPLGHGGECHVPPKVTPAPAPIVPAPEVEETPKAEEPVVDESRPRKGKG